MKKNKTLLIVIIVLLVILAIGGGTFAYIYFGTDLLKSDKELFAKYTMLIGDDEEGFSPRVLAEYENKKELTPYQNSGSFSVNNQVISNDNLSLEVLGVFQALVEKSNETNITFSGKTDRANMLVEEDISINYSDTVNLPFKYKQDGDLYGIQADILSPNYFAVENNNLQDLLLKLGATDVSGIPNRIEPTVIESLQFTDEEKTHILNNYIMPIYNNLPEEKFSKNENSDGSNDYILTLTFDEVQDLLIQALQTLSNDQMMLTKINNILQELYGESVDTITSQDVQSAIEELQGATVDQGNVVIKVTEKDRKTTKIAFDFNDEDASIIIEISKTQNESGILYDFNIDISTPDTEGIKDIDGININMQMSYGGINTDNVSENINIAIAIPEMMNLSYAYNNNISFGNVSIEPFDSNNVAVLNNYPAEQLQPFVVQLAYVIAETNASQMQQIGYSEEFINPMVIWFGAPVIYSSLGIYNDAVDTVTDNNLDELEIQVNNQQFENYKGEISGTQVRALCDLVGSHNLSSLGDNLINIKLGEAASSTTMTSNINDIEQIKSSILAGRNYNVTMTYDSNTGYICEIGIVEI